MNYLVLYVSICSLISFYICSSLITHWRRASFRKVHGCQPVKKLPQYPFLRGFDMIVNFKHWLRDGEFMETTTRLLAEHGGTFSMRAGGGVGIWTCDLENVKAILSSKTDDFDLPWIRIKTFTPFLGTVRSLPRGLFGPMVGPCSGLVSLIYKFPISTYTRRTFGNSLDLFCEMGQQLIFRTFSKGLRLILRPKSYSESQCMRLTLMVQRKILAQLSTMHLREFLNAPT